MSVRPGDIYLGATLAATVCLLALLVAQPLLGERAFRERTGATAALVRELSLVDLALLPEASYTRHPSQADLFTPFQSHPLALDLFPAGSLLPPPSHLTPSAEPELQEADAHARP